MNIDRCPTCKRRIRRSSKQNRRYWALLHAMAEKIRPLGVSFSAETWHLWAKSKWMGCNDAVLPNGKVMTIPHSTADLDTPEFNDYMTRCEEWANEHGAWLEDTEGAA